VTAALEPGRLSTFVVSNEPWGPQHFIKHRFAIELARRGAEVFFCDPPPPWSAAALVSRDPELQPIEPDLTLLSYRHPAPARIGERAAAAINDRVMGRRLRGLVTREIPVLWQFDAFRFAANHLGSGSLKIYHVCDPYLGFALDEPSAEAADLIVCTSRLYAEHYAAKHPDKTIHVPHSSTAGSVRSGDGLGEATRERFGDYLFFGGSITDFVDLSLLARVSDEIPEAKLVIAGPVVGGGRTREAFAELSGRENVVHLGTVPATDIEELVAGSRLCLSAYDFDERTTLGPRTSILKVMDYMARGRALVSSSPLEYSELEGRAIYCRSNAGDYVDAVRRVLDGELTVDVDAVDRFLAERTYGRALDRILTALGDIRSGAGLRP